MNLIEAAILALTDVIQAGVITDPDDEEDIFVAIGALTQYEI